MKEKTNKKKTKQKQNKQTKKKKKQGMPVIQSNYPWNEMFKWKHKFTVFNVFLFLAEAID